MTSLSDMAKGQLGGRLAGAAGSRVGSRPRAAGTQPGKDDLHSIGSLETWEPPDKSFTKHGLKAGEGDSAANEGSVITVNITPLSEYNIDEGALGGYKFLTDCETTVGEGDTLISEMLDKVVMSMVEGERAYIKTKMDEKGNKVNEIGVDNKSMKFNITLKSLSRSADITDLEKDEMLDRAHHHKEKGTELYKADRTDFSVKRFNRALQNLLAMEPVDASLPEPLKERYLELKCQCYNNLAACFLKMEKYEDVIESSTNAIQCSGENVKALFRRGQANSKLHQYDEAKSDLTKALKLEPVNKAVRNRLREVEEMIKKEKQMYQKMFNK